MTVALVLYEDSRGVGGDFGPHDLLAALVADERGTDVYSVLRVAKGIPMKGVGDLLKAIKELDRFRNFAPGGAPILIVVDNDKIRDHLKLPDAPSADVESAIRSRCDQPDRLEIALLEDNVESLIQAVRDCDQPPTLGREQIDAALAKDINARDLVLTKVARDPGRRALRDCVRKRMPSLEAAIAFVFSSLGA